MRDDGELRLARFSVLFTCVLPRLRFAMDSTLCMSRTDPLMPCLRGGSVCLSFRDEPFSFDEV